MAVGSPHSFCLRRGGRSRPAECWRADSPSGRCAWLAHRTEKRINAVKRLAVSTGQLRRLPALHTRPINLVVFQEPTPRRAGNLILKGVSRLYAFSVYPFRT